MRESEKLTVGVEDNKQFNRKKTHLQMQVSLASPVQLQALKSYNNVLKQF